MSEDEMKALIDARTRHCKDLFRKHFWNLPDDLSVIVLKGHLLVEQSLTAIISHYVGASGELAEARLQFSQKVALVKAFVGWAFPVEVEPWDFLKLLNRLRNDFAHELEPKKLAAHLTAVRAMASARRNEEQELSLETDAGNLKFIISFWLGVLDPVDALIHTMEKSKAYTADLSRLGQLLRRCREWGDDSKDG